MSAWRDLQLLTEYCDDDGAAALPKNYRIDFRTMDKAGCLIENDITRICRHIIPVGEGRYVLSLEEKPAIIRK